MQKQAKCFRVNRLILLLYAWQFQRNNSNFYIFHVKSSVLQASPVLNIFQIEMVLLPSNSLSTPKLPFLLQCLYLVHQNKHFLSWLTRAFNLVRVPGANTTECLASQLYFTLLSLLGIYKALCAIFLSHSMDHMLSVC